MRKLTHYLTLSLMAAALLVSPALADRVFAQEPAAAAPAAPSPQDKECSDLYDKFVDLWATKKDQKAGYPVGKQYLEKCGTRANEFTTYVKGRVEKYEAATLRYNFDQAAVTGKAESAADVYNYGKQLLAQKPDDLSVTIALGHYGALAYQAKNQSYKADAITNLKQSIQKLEAGAEPPKGGLFSTNQDALAWLNHDLGSVLYGEKSFAEAIGPLYKAATSSLSIKNYDMFYLAEAYRQAEVEPALAEFKKFEGKDVTPESEAAQNKWYQTMERANDYYARAYVGNTDAATKPLKDASLEQLTIYYKIRHTNSTDAEVNSYIASVTKSPIPDPKSPLPALPATPATPATATGTTPTGSATTEMPIPTGNSAGSASPSARPAAGARPAGAKATRGSRNRLRAH